MTPATLRESGAALYGAGDLAGAERRFQLALSMAPADPVSLECWARTVDRLGRPGEALAAYRRLATGYPRIAAVHLQESHLQAALGRFRRARAAALRAAALAPDMADALDAAGLAHNNVGSAADGVSYFRRAVALAPRSPGPRLHLGIALTGLDRYDEAASALRRAVALDPRDPVALRRLGSIGRSIRTGLALHIWPRSQGRFADLEDLVRRFVVPHLAQPPRLRRDSRVTTMGSCFAENVAAALAEIGVDARAFPFGEDVNSTFANRILLDGLIGGARQGPAFEALVEALGRPDLDGFERRLADTDVFVLTLGVAPCVFDGSTGAFAFPSPADRRRVGGPGAPLVFRMTTLDENVANVLAIVALLRRRRPGMHVFLTVSPVPLKASYSARPAILDDCASKSLLRTTCDVVMGRGLEDVRYWPSFEIVRWLGAHLPRPVFGSDDGFSRHVDRDMVALIVRVFAETVLEPAPTLP